MNQITFPAAILQPPFFDVSADPAVNYGAIGGVIGHEIGHGFDDQGRAFDEAGRTRNWWSAETDTKFKAATEQLAAQYAKYCPVPNGCINGQLTMGENIGDLGGLTMAYTAYKLSLNGKEAPVIEVDGVVHRRPAILPGLGAGVARDGPRGRHAPASRHRSALDAGVPHQRRRPQHGRVVRGIRRQAEGDKLYLPPEQRVRIW